MSFLQKLRNELEPRLTSSNKYIERTRIDVTACIAGIRSGQTHDFVICFEYGELHYGSVFFVISRSAMATIVLQLDPRRLSNPDSDICYALPDLLVARSNGRLTDNGYDYAGEGGDSYLLLFLETEDPVGVLPDVIDALSSERVLDNDLSAVPVAVEDGDDFRVVHPHGFIGEFRRSSDG